MVRRAAPFPITQVLLKLHSRCNLSCDYCYVYEYADQSWRGRPPTMARATIDAVATRIAEHAARWDLPAVTVILHGGEPLLAGTETIEYVATSIRSAVAADIEVRLTMQTNGLLLTPSVLQVLDRHGIRVGISVDGDRTAHDRHRTFAHGGGSHDRVRAALDLIMREQYRHLYSGLLCTVDIRNDPLAVYNGLLAFAPPRIDLLLPHGNWSAPPPFRSADALDAPYGDWLIRVFDEWYDSAQHRTDIRLFQAIMSLLFGGPSHSEAVGLEPLCYLVIETDGSLEQGDALKTAGDGMAATGLDVFKDSFDQVLALPGVRAQQAGLAALSDTCRDCPVVRVCGGGQYAHRYREPDGFKHPTVYCHDQRRLIEHVRDRVATDVLRLTPPRAELAAT